MQETFLQKFGKLEERGEGLSARKESAKNEDTTSPEI